MGDAAHKRGKLVVTPIGTLDQALDAIDAGADGLAHLCVGSASKPDFGRLASSHQIFVIPTLSGLQTIRGANVSRASSLDARRGMDKFELLIAPSAC